MGRAPARIPVGVASIKGPSAGNLRTVAAPPAMQVGDCRHLTRLGFVPSSIDCIITSPPYWRLKRYGAASAEIGQGALDDYLAAVRGVFAECASVASPSATMWVISDTQRMPVRQGGSGELIPLPFELAREAEACGWRLHDVIIWHKGKTLPYSGTGRLRNLVEYVTLFVRASDFRHRPFRLADRHWPDAEWLAGWPERYHPLGRRPANLWTVPIPTQGMWAHGERLHFCPFPPELVARLIALTTDEGDSVFDPFAGIGTVPAQALAMNRLGCGVELNPSFVRTFFESTLPDVSAAWVRGEERRKLIEHDQLSEARLIFQLRCLKAGKELLRLLERREQGRHLSQSYSTPSGVVVLAPADFAPFVDARAGSIARPPVELLVLFDGPDSERLVLVAEIADALRKPPFSKLGLDIGFEAVSPGAVDELGVLTIDDHSQQLVMFSQSRHGALTVPVTDALFSSAGGLLTNVRLARPVRSTGRSPLEEARRAAEESVLAEEVRRGGSVEEIAGRLDIGAAELHAMLLEHGLVPERRVFGVAMPVQLRMPTAGVFDA